MAAVGTTPAARAELDRLVAACDLPPAQVVAGGAARDITAVTGADDRDLLLVAYPVQGAPELAAALHARAERRGRLPIVVLAEELTAEVAAFANGQGARICLFSHGADPLRLAILAAARDAIAYRERREMEAASEQVRALVHSSVSDVVFHIRVEGDRFRFVEVNPVFLRATGLQEAQVVGKFVDEVIPEPSCSQVTANYRQAIAERRTVRWEEITPYPAGKKYGEVSITPVIDAHGRCTHMVGTVQDVTEARIHAETIRQYADIVRNVQIGLTVWNVPDAGDAGRITLEAFNPAASELSDTDLSPLVGRSFGEIYAGARAGQMLELIREVARDHAVHEVPPARVGERALAFKGFPLPGERVGLALEDMTEQVRARSATATQRRLLEMVASGAPLATTLDALAWAMEEELPVAVASVRLASPGDGHVPGGTPRLTPVPATAGWSMSIATATGRALGTISLTFREPREPTEAEKELIDGFSNVAGIAIQRHEFDEQLRELTARIDDAREEERVGIARELHDQLGQLLTVLKMDMAWVAGGLRSPDELKRDALVGRLTAMMHMSDEVISQVRRISAELRPAILDQLGLGEALSWQAQEFTARTQLPCKVESRLDQDLPLDRGVALTVYRVFQEALTNIARHAGARRVDVSVEEEDGAIVLQVRDDGRGITPDEIEDPRSLGLVGMRERARRLGGSVTLARREPRGTVVTLTVPIG